MLNFLVTLRATLDVVGLVIVCIPWLVMKITDYANQL